MSVLRLWRSLEQRLVGKQKRGTGKKVLLMTTLSQNAFLLSYTENSTTELPLTAESCRGVLLGAELLAEKNYAYNYLRETATAGIPAWLRLIGPVSVQGAREQGHMPVWTPPDGSDIFCWLRALHNMRIVSQLWPDAVTPYMHVRGIGEGRSEATMPTRLTWEQEGVECAFAELILRAL